MLTSSFQKRPLMLSSWMYRFYLVHFMNIRITVNNINGAAASGEICIQNAHYRE